MSYPLWYEELPKGWGKFVPLHHFSFSSRGSGLLVQKTVKYRSPEYHSWYAMLQRCYYKKRSKNEQYREHGILVCRRWVLSFQDFLKDMGPRPYGMSLDRKNVYGNYSPDNCRWATASEQSRNKRV